jgi:hypothetical protein
VDVGTSVAVGVPVAVGVRVGVSVPVGVLVDVGGREVSVGVAVAGSSVGVLEETTVGKNWVGVGSSVAVGVLTTRVGSGVGPVEVVTVGVRNGVSSGVSTRMLDVILIGVIAPEPASGAEARAAMPAQ